MPIWCRLFMHWTLTAFSLALAKAGRSSAARMAMMAITTSNSISVKARLTGQRRRGRVPRRSWRSAEMFIFVRIGPQFGFYQYMRPFAPANLPNN